jgi:hypothetical protein
MLHKTRKQVKEKNFCLNTSTENKYESNPENIFSSGRYFREFRFRDFSRVLSLGIESHFETRKVSKVF